MQAKLKKKQINNQNFIFVFFIICFNCSWFILIFDRIYSIFLIFLTRLNQLGTWVGSRTGSGYVFKVAPGSGSRTNQSGFPTTFNITEVRIKNNIKPNRTTQIQQKSKGTHSYCTPLNTYIEVLYSTICCTQGEIIQVIGVAGQGIVLVVGGGGMGGEGWGARLLANRARIANQDRAVPPTLAILHITVKQKSLHTKKG